MKWLKRILLGFCLIFLVLMAFPLYAYLTVDRSPPFIKLSSTRENGQPPCPRRHWDSISENAICYQLQEALTEAASRGDTAAVDANLQKGANPDGSYYQSDSSIHYAAMKGQHKVAEVLIENGADVNRLGKWGISPLQTATQYNHYSVAKILLENGADVCHEASFDDLTTPTALDLAVRRNNFEMIKLLTAHGALLCGFQMRN